MLDHSSGIVSSISILSVHGPVGLLQWPLHSSNHVMVDTADSFPTVNQSSSFRNCSIFHFIEFHQDGDTSI